jgi:cystathionine beta-lyase/cystathionine gamma-synthase
VTELPLREASDSLRHIPAGEIIPASTVHGVSVSLPDLASVIGFEGHDEATLRRIRRGYPRFRLHPYVERVAELIAADHAASRPGAVTEGTEVVPVRSSRAARAASSYAGLPATSVAASHGVSAVVVAGGSDAAQRLRAYLQHTGSHLTSRHAEDVLLAAGLLAHRQDEATRPEDPERRLAEAIAGFYGLPDSVGVSLHNSGMNAIHAAVAALHEIQGARGRRRWLQLGWIFFDTVKLFEKGIVDAECEVVPDPFDVDGLARVVRAHAADLVGIVAEVPSNPLVQTPDVQVLRELADEVGCAVVLDSTLGTPHNVDVVGYADVVCESLTKYAAGSADVLLGTAVVNPASAFADQLREAVPGHGEPPYPRDAARLAERIRGYGDRMRRVNANAMVLADFFAGQDLVERVLWAYEPRSADNYRKVARRADSPGGVLMLDLRVPLEQVYDHLAVAKGPSFGAEFTMAAPQVFIAHFDLLSTAAGRSVLRDHGLHRDMLRVSVGTEPIDDLTTVFADAFAHAGER